MPKMLPFAALAVVLSTSALAVPIPNSTLSGTITDWPAGQTGEMQLRLLDFITDQAEVVVLSTKIDGTGNFSLKLPDAKALAKVLPDKDSSYSFAGACRGSLSLESAAQINFFDLRAFVDGKQVSNVKFRTSRTPWPWLADNFHFQTLAFASANTSIDGAASCDLQNSPFYSQNGSRMRVEVTAKLAAGWNTLSGTNSGSKMVLGDEAMPGNAFWHVLIGYGGIGLKPGTTDDKKNVQVLSVTPGGAAEAAGIKEGDLILAVDDTPADPNNLPGMAERVRGEENTTVTLTVKRGDQTLKIPIKRQFVRMN